MSNVIVNDETDANLKQFANEVADALNKAKVEEAPSQIIGAPSKFRIAGEFSSVDECMIILEAASLAVDIIRDEDDEQPNT